MYTRSQRQNSSHFGFSDDARLVFVPNRGPRALYDRLGMRAGGEPVQAAVLVPVGSAGMHVAHEIPGGLGQAEADLANQLLEPLSQGARAAWARAASTGPQLLTGASSVATNSTRACSLISV